MRNPNKIRIEIDRLKIRLRAGDPVAMNNLAATYRELGNRRCSFYWWTRAATQSDGGAFLELGYCYYYGIGVRRNYTLAVTNYRKAIRSTFINEYDREEARYHLAITLLDTGNNASVRRRATELLQDAAIDDDYPEAADLLRQLSSLDKLNVCRCRRGLLRALGG